jgi:hypothetical protein
LVQSKEKGALVTLPTKSFGFPYPGGKITLAADFIRYLPKKGRKFVDCCAGRGNITLRAMHEGFQFDEWILNDPLTANFFRAIRDHGDTFVAEEKSQEEYDRCKQLSIGGDPYALLMEPFLCWNGGSFKDNGMRGDGGGRRSPESHTELVRDSCLLLRDHNVIITDLDWLDCLQSHELGPQDVVVADFPYINCDTGAYSPETICPTEVIEYFREAPSHCIFCEYAQPMYLVAFGEPVFTKTVQLKSVRVRTTREKRTECLWIHEPVARRNVTLSRFISAVPEDRKKSYYTSLSIEELLGEIKTCIGSVSFSRNEMQKEMRLRLLPILLELKKRTFRGHPNYYESLAKIGLNPDTIRQWFYRSKIADDAISLLEEEKLEPPTKQRQHGRVTENMLLIADGMAYALRGGKISHAKKLATQWIEARGVGHPKEEVLQVPELVLDLNC